MSPARKRKQEEIDENLKFFRDRLPSLIVDHSGKYALIRHREIMGIYDTVVDAQLSGAKFYDDGIFSVQKISDEPINLGIFTNAVHLG